MSDNAPNPNLHALLTMAESAGHEARPTLLRALTDFYVSRDSHSSEETQQYTEIMLRSLDLVDVPTRANIAKRLANYSDAPLVIINRLARDVFAVAEPILQHAQGLTDEELDLIAAERGASHAAIIVERQRAQALAAPTRDPFARKIQERWQLCDQFFAADVTERRLILANLEFAPRAPVQAISAPENSIRLLEASALQHNANEFIRTLAHALGVTNEFARRMYMDPLGEPMVVAAKVLGMPVDVLQRILLFLNPSVSHSVQRIYDLSRLYDEITPEIADRLLAIWRSSQGHEPKTLRALAQSASLREKEDGDPCSNSSSPRLGTHKPIAVRTAGSRAG
jgi:hypothetical protein